MRFGTYYFLQAPPALAHPEVVRREIEQMAWTEELGFDSIWLTEHHFIEYGLSVSPAVLAAAAAMRTRRVRIGLAAAILPFHDPVRLAEELAMVDILSGGRLDVGVGRLASRLRRTDRRRGPGRGEGRGAVVPGGPATVSHPRADRARAPALAAGVPRHGGAAREGHVGPARRRDRRLRLCRHGRGEDRRAAGPRCRRGAVLDELRGLAPGGRAALDGAVRSRGHAPVSLTGLLASSLPCEFGTATLARDVVRNDLRRLPHRSVLVAAGPLHRQRLGGPARPHALRHRRAAGA